MSQQPHAALLIATGNPGKLREITAILGELPVRIRSLEEFPGLPAPHEDADTFEGNARLKALHYAGLTGLPTLAEDSGLEVEALGGAPGVRSARFAGPDRNDAANNAALVAALSGVDSRQRTARYRCAAVLAIPGRLVAEAYGALEGRIIDEPRGRGGFGYDPHFLVPEFGKTAAELPPQVKNRISHRGQAIRSLKPHILEFFPGTKAGGYGGSW